MADAPSQAPRPIEIDSPCIHCGYNLRALLPDGNCPECGQPISGSLAGDRLCFADPAWLMRVRFGVALKLWNLLIAVLPASGLVRVSGLPLLEAVLVTGSSALGLWATFCLTTQEPRTTLTENRVSLRAAIRAGAIAVIIGNLATHYGTGSIPAQAIWISAAVAGLVGAAVFLGELSYLRRFALRIPNESIELLTTFLMWLLPFCLGIGALAGATVAVVVSTGVRDGPVASIGAVGGIICFLIAVALFVLSICYIVLLFRFRSAFNTAIAEADSGVPTQLVNE